MRQRRWQRERLLVIPAAFEIVAPHTGQSSQLFSNTGHGNGVTESDRLRLIELKNVFEKLTGTSPVVSSPPPFAAALNCFMTASCHAAPNLPLKRTFHILISPDISQSS